MVSWCSFRSTAKELEEPLQLKDRGFRDASLKKYW
jgi:hypothetical protein